MISLIMHLVTSLIPFLIPFKPLISSFNPSLHPALPPIPHQFTNPNPMPSLPIESKGIKRTVFKQKR